MSEPFRPGGNCCGMNSEPPTVDARVDAILNELVDAGIVAPHHRGLMRKVLMLTVAIGESAGLDRVIATLSGRAAA
jgi:hypothetical protein